MTAKHKKISLSRPDASEVDVEAVAAVLRSGRLSLGPVGPQFEAAFAEAVGAKHAVAVSSGTAALHLCLIALGIGPGDEVITTPFSFVASANCILYVGARPIFVDIDEHTLNLDSARLEAAVSERTRAILPVHVFGRPCAIDTIMAMAEGHKLVVVEDACEALGARFAGRAVGTFGRAGTFAFYPNKQMTTGEGGMVVTDDDAIAELCRSLRNQGRGGAGWLEHERLGFNYRLSDIQSALGLSQLRRVPGLLRRRAQVAQWYREVLADVEEIILPPPPPETTEMSWFVFVVRLADEFTGEDRDRLLQELRSRGIECSNYFPPIHLQPYFREKFGFSPGSFPVAERVAARTVALPFHGGLTCNEVSTVARAVREAVKRINRPKVALGIQASA